MRKTTFPQRSPKWDRRGEVCPNGTGQGSARPGLRPPDRSRRTARPGLALANPLPDPSELFKTTDGALMLTEEPSVPWTLGDAGTFDHPGSPLSWSEPPWERLVPVA